jgi:hypothetical protein
MMQYITFNSETREILSKGTGTYSPPPGIEVKQVTADEYGLVDPLTDYIDSDGHFAAYPSDIIALRMNRPAGQVTWDGEKWAHTASLEQRRAEVWDQIKRARYAMEYGAFSWNGHAFDADAESQRRLGTVAAASKGVEGFTVTWTLANNETIVLTSDDLQSIVDTQLANISDYYSHARILRESIESATTLEQLDAISW